jgi:hypothetical protein
VVRAFTWWGPPGPRSRAQRGVFALGMRGQRLTQRSKDAKRTGMGKRCYGISGTVRLREVVLYVVRSSRGAKTSAARRHCDWDARTKAHAKKLRRKERSSLVGSPRERIPNQFVTPLLLPGVEKGSGDEVGEHAQFVFCEPYGVRKISSRPCS